MDIYWAHIKGGNCKHLQHCIDLGTRREKEKGQAQTTWRQSVEKERNLAGWRSWAEARAAAVDRPEWRRLVEALCATRNLEDR